MDQAYHVVTEINTITDYVPIKYENVKCNRVSHIVGIDSGTFRELK